MDKRALIAKMIEKIEADRLGLAEAARNTYEAATHEESEAEDQYDTRGLEASYLAGAQAKRVAELDQTINTLRFIELKKFTNKSPISATALVEMECEGKKGWYILLPNGGGLSVEFESHTVHIVTPQSPMGEAMIGRSVGDIALVDTGRETREYEILSIQ